MGETFISIDNLFKVFTSKAEDLTVLRGTSFQIEKGEIVCLLGTSGSGKTTTLNLLAGIDKPTSGKISYGGEDISKWDTTDLYDYRLREIGFIFQDFHLMEHLTALENVMVPILLMKKGEEEAKEIALELLNKVGLGTKALNHPEELSSGEKQRVCVARAVANSPSILIADEPTGTLDSKSGDIIMNLLLDLSKKNKMTMIYTTHDPYLARIATRLLIIQKGIISEIEATNIKEIDYDNIIFEYKANRDVK
ncbi:MAG: ABC transporter ATP-binding protein [Candidatus Thorarchaeota archaeon]